MLLSNSKLNKLYSFSSLIFSENISTKTSHTVMCHTASHLVYSHWLLGLLSSKGSQLNIVRRVCGEKYGCCMFEANSFKKSPRSTKLHVCERPSLSFLNKNHFFLFILFPYFYGIHCRETNIKLEEIREINLKHNLLES